MRKYLMGLVLFAVLSATVYSQDAAWKEYVHSDNLMAFSMPADPTYGTQSVKTKIGKITIESYILENKSGALMVMVNSYPDRILKSSPQKLLAAGRDGAVGNIHGTVVSEKPISIEGNPGTEFVFKSAQWHGLYRIYLVGTRLYQLGALSPAGGADFPDVDKFMDSFRLVKK